MWSAEHASSVSFEGDACGPAFVAGCAHHVYRSSQIQRSTQTRLAREAPPNSLLQFEGGAGKTPEVQGPGRRHLGATQTTPTRELVVTVTLETSCPAIPNEDLKRRAHSHVL